MQKIQETFTLPCPPERLMEVITSPEYQDFKKTYGKAAMGTSSVKQEGGQVTIDNTRRYPSDDLPAAARKMAGDTFGLVEQQVWDTTSRTGTIAVSIHRAPVAFEGTSRITEGAAPGTSELSIDGGLNVNVPLLGGKMEKEALPSVLEALTDERDAVTEWLQRG